MRGMTDNRHSLLDQDTVAATEQGKLLLGFFDEQQLQERLQTSHTRQTTIDSEEMLAKHRQAIAAIGPLEYEITNPEIRPLPDIQAITEHVDQLRELEFVRETYGDEITVGLVPISHLIAQQAFITTTGRQGVPDWETSPKEVVEYALPTEREQPFFEQPLQTPDDQFLGVQITSRSPNISVAEMRLTDSEKPMRKSVVVELNAPPNLVNVSAINNRLFLNNGYHRVYQLLSAGETHIPAIIQQDDNLQATPDFAVDKLFSDRPPVVPDFQSNIATTIDRPATNKFIQIVAQTASVYR